MVRQLYVELPWNWEWLSQEPGSGRPHLKSSASPGRDRSVIHLKNFKSPKVGDDVPQCEAQRTGTVLLRILIANCVRGPESISGPDLPPLRYLTKEAFYKGGINNEKL